MANSFLNLPMPAGNGAGAAVDTSQLGRTKTITVAGFFPRATITIEISTDGGTSWAPVFSFQNDDLGRQTLLVSANRMRVNVSGRTAVFSANADVGGFVNPPTFVNLPMPALNGAGAAVDVSAAGRFMTFVVGGVFPGSAVAIEASEDGVDFVPLWTFNLAGLQTLEVVTQFLRVSVSGRNTLRPFTATIDVGLGDFDTGAGGGSSASVQLVPETWAQNDVPADQAATAMETEVSQLFSDYRMIRDGSITGLSLRFNDNLTGGSATAEVTVNGAGTGFTVTVASGSSGAFATQAAGTDAYVAGDRIGVRLLTDVGFLPDAELDCEASVEVTGS